MRFLIVEDDDWEILNTTLQLDARSSAFDRDLRTQIDGALHSTVELTEEEISTVIGDVLIDRMGASKNEGYGLAEEAVANLLKLWISRRNSVLSDQSLLQ